VNLSAQGGKAATIKPPRGKQCTEEGPNSVSSKEGVVGIKNGLVYIGSRRLVGLSTKARNKFHPNVTEEKR